MSKREIGEDEVRERGLTMEAFHVAGESWGYGDLLSLEEDVLDTERVRLAFAVLAEVEWERAELQRMIADPIWADRRDHFERRLMCIDAILARATAATSAPVRAMEEIVFGEDYTGGTDLCSGMTHFEDY